MMCPGQPTPREWLDSLPKDDPIGRRPADLPTYEQVGRETIASDQLARDRRIGANSGMDDWMKPGVMLAADRDKAQADRIRFAATFVRDTIAGRARHDLPIDPADAKMLHNLLDRALND